MGCVSHREFPRKKTAQTFLHMESGQDLGVGGRRVFKKTNYQLLRVVGG